jgi:hypothetical protein
MGEDTLYKTRFWVLGLFSALSFTQSLIWLTFSTVPEESEREFGLNDRDVDVLCLYGGLTFLIAGPVAIWALESHAVGLRRAVLGE